MSYLHLFNETDNTLIVKCIEQSITLN